jgi:hypothetical protein
MNLKIALKEKSGLGFHGSVVVTGVAFAFALALFIQTPADAQSVEEVVASTGCAMAHCDRALSDNAHLLPPLSSQVQAWRDTGVNGSRLGIGCSSNGDIVACSFGSTSSKRVEIRAYNADGELWSSTALGSSAWYSAPIVDPYGGVIAVDQSQIIRFDPQGVVIWKGTTAGGQPMSCNVTGDGQIVLATQWGPVSAYDYTSGTKLAQLRLNDTVQYNGRSYSGFFDTVNVPAVRGNRVYVSTQFNYGTYHRRLPIGRLYALDLVRDQENKYSFVIAWKFEFKAPSGSSPTLGSDEEGNTVIYFDGNGLTPGGASRPLALAVKDLTTSGELLWSYALAASPQASPALDPRGGIWFYPFRRSQLLRLSESDGQPIQTINISTLIANSSATFPVSVMTISGDATTGPVVMLVAASTSTYSTTYVVAIDLSVDLGNLLWKYRIDEGKGLNGVTFGQFPVLLDGDKPVVIFSTYQNGVWALRE